LGLVVAGAVGAPARYLVDRWVQGRTGGDWPWGTFVVNVSGSFAFGLLSGLALYHGLADGPRVVLGTGFCGAFTTFSTFTYETVRLLEEGELGAALRNAAGSLVAGLVAATAGLALASL